jgi:hypothetical protein
MPGVILRTTAVKVVNKGGGHKTKTVREPLPDPDGELAKEAVKLGLRLKKSIKRYLRSNQRVPGTDYVVFECPGCGARNKRSMYDVKGATTDGQVSFKCNRCYREIEVAKPIDLIPPMVKPDSPGGLVGPHGQAL